MESKDIKWVVVALLLIGGGYWWFNKKGKEEIVTEPNNTNGNNNNNGGNGTIIKEPTVEEPKIYQGYVESVTPDRVFGWAALDKNPCSVDVYIDGNKFATVPPTEPRTDVATYLGSGKLNFGFLMAIPEKKGSKDVGKHEVKVVYSGTNIDLQNSPMYYVIEPIQTTTGTPTTTGGIIRNEPTPIPTIPYYPPITTIPTPPIDNVNSTGIDDFYNPPPNTINTPTNSGGVRGNPNILQTDNG